MWRLLRENIPKARFRRQVPIRSFVADFACHRLKLVIEVDGGQHGDEADRQRDRTLASKGYRVLRFWSNDVLGNREGIAAAVAAALHGGHPHPALPHQGGGN